MINDRNKCPFPGQEKDWEDWCDWMNNEGQYKDGKPMFCKHYFFISRSDDANPVIETIKEPKPIKKPWWKFL